MDVADIAPGAEFARVIDTELGSCGAVLAVIGLRWKEAFDAHRDGTDYVRLELRQALGHAGVTVVPVLVQGATLPAATELPGTSRRSPAARRSPSGTTAGATTSRTWAASSVPPSGSARSRAGSCRPPPR